MLPCIDSAVSSVVSISRVSSWTNKSRFFPQLTVTIAKSVWFEFHFSRRETNGLAWIIKPSRPDCLLNSILKHFTRSNKLRNVTIPTCARSLNRALSRDTAGQGEWSPDVLKTEPLPSRPDERTRRQGKREMRMTIHNETFPLFSSRAEGLAGDRVYCTWQ